MRIYVTVKQAGKRKGYITDQELELPSAPTSLRELIHQVVHIQVDAYNRKAIDSAIFYYLSDEAIESQAETGRVQFGDRRNAQQEDVNKAISTAILAFEDGVYRVFADEEELIELDTAIDLREGTKVAFIRFTMLAGRMW